MLVVASGVVVYALRAVAVVSRPKSLSDSGGRPALPLSPFALSRIAAGSSNPRDSASYLILDPISVPSWNISPSPENDSSPSQTGSGPNAYLPRYETKMQ